MKSVRIIVETVVAAIQNGLGQRDARRAQRGAPETKQQPVAAAAAVAAVEAPEPEIDLSKVDLPADVAAVVEGEVEGTTPKRKVVRPKKALVKAE